MSHKNNFESIDRIKPFPNKEKQRQQPKETAKISEQIHQRFDDLFDEKGMFEYPCPT